MEIQPILLGADLNCYSMARAFYEAAGVVSIGVGKCRLGATRFSRFLRFTPDKRMETDEGRLEVLREIAAKMPENMLIVLGCTDEYASFLIRYKEQLGSFIVPYPPKEMLCFANKKRFLYVCEKEGIRTPKTVFVEDGEAIPQSLPFHFPIVLKPASSEEYWKHPFPKMEKVYFPKNRAQAEKILHTFRDAGYKETVLLQETLSLRDIDNYVLTIYCDSEHRATAAVFGRVLLEEKTAKGTGNPAAILTGEELPEIGRQLIALLEKIRYTGFANFDIVRDEAGDSVLEMNLRQGRSNHDLCAAGINPAMLLLRDYVYRLNMPLADRADENLWTSVPFSVLIRKIGDEKLRVKCKELFSNRMVFSPFEAADDLFFNPLRRLFVWEHNRRQKKRFCRGSAY